MAASDSNVLKLAPEPGAPAFRTAPHNIEAEQALLGAILVNNDAFYRVSDFLEPKHFFEPIHQTIFETAASIIRAGKIATPVTLKTFLAADLDLGIRIIPLATIREADGLAMSSRNRYLSDEHRALAPLLQRVMQALAARIRNRDDLFKAVADAQNEIIGAGFELDYLEARHAETLAPVASLADGPIRLILAARIGSTRLLDNIPV